ncbi:MAG: chorismate mutase [Micrococcales bacterium]|nr:chorismate mutase [Micrococcales bacterium]
MRAIRGATQLAADDAAEMSEATVELLEQMLTRNGLRSDDLISVIFTATPDLVCGFPAAAARDIGFGDVPLLCASEIAVAGAPEHIIRVMMYAETELSRDQVQHVYLRGAEVLRQDLAQ